MRALLLLLWPAALSSTQPFPLPIDLGRPVELGYGVQRTMHLLSSSTPEQRDTVRLLFYGQSITEQGWWRTVVDDLRQRFPHAHLIASTTPSVASTRAFCSRPRKAISSPFIPTL